MLSGPGWATIFPTAPETFGRGKKPAAAIAGPVAANDPGEPDRPSPQRNKQKRVQKAKKPSGAEAKS